MRPRLPAHLLWPAVIAGALVLHVVASLIVVAIATSNPSYAVEENYYQKAVAWDARRHQEQHNAELGWRLDVEVERPASPGGEARLAARLRDAEGRPLDGGSMSVEAFHNARAGEILRATLSEEGDGDYATRLPMHRSGVWELRFTVERAAERFTHTEKRYLSLEAKP